jgi:cytochrome c oxidase assembly factor CtaG
VIARSRELVDARRGWASWDLAVAALLALVAGPSTLVDVLSHRSLAFHMTVQHALLLGAGALAAAAAADVPVLGSLRRAVASRPGLGAAAFVGTIALWHVPALFGLATADDAVHGLMHVSYVGAGFALAVALPALGGYGRAVLLLGLQSAMAVLALAMAVGALVYPQYPAPESVRAGIGMLILMQLTWLVLPFGGAVGRGWRSSDLARPVAVLLTGSLLLSMAWPG